MGLSAARSLPCGLGRGGKHVVQLPPQGLDIAVPAVHLGQQGPHGGQGLGLAPVPGDLQLVPARGLKHAGGPFPAVPLQDLAPQDGDLPRAWTTILQRSPETRSSCTTTLSPMVIYSPGVRLKQSIKLPPFLSGGAVFQSEIN